MNRPTWDEYFMAAAKLAATRSTCIRRQVGAVIVKNRMIISSGYNGSPRGIAHCVSTKAETGTGCLREQMNIPSGERHEMCSAIHAEQNAIIQCARTGASTNNTTLYCTTYPCSICAKIIINAGIAAIVYKGDYPDDKAKELFKEAGISVSQMLE